MSDIQVIHAKRIRQMNADLLGFEGNLKGLPDRTIEEDRTGAILQHIEILDDILSFPLTFTYEGGWRQVVRLNQLWHGRPDTDPVGARIVELTGPCLQGQR